MDRVAQTAAETGGSAGGPGHPEPPVVEFREITKQFPGQRAVDRVSFSIRRGEVHALVGENGAGKTTLIKVLAGGYEPDAGELLIDGEPVDFSHPSEATAAGIACIHQDPNVQPALSVAENLTIGVSFETSRLGLIDWSAQRDMARRALDRVGLDVDPGVRMGNLSLYQQQLASVARVLLQDPRLVVLDEVTAPLTLLEVDLLFARVRDLRREGVSIIYISHRLDEIFRIADRVTVLKNGRHVATRDVAGLDTDSLTRLIVGKDLADLFVSQQPLVDEENAVLSVRDLTDPVLKGVSFDLHAGEVLGLAGLAGAGRTNILEALFGARVPDAGTIALDGRRLALKHPADAIRHGVALITEDRKHNGYIANFSIWKSVTLPWLRKFTRAGRLRIGAERKSAREAAKRLDVRAPSVDASMSQLSGGNQQKVILARWLSQSIRVLLLDEPTHGVDIGAKEEIYRIIREIAGEGIPVLVVSSEFEELEGLCTRVLLLSEGEVIGELTGDAIDQGAMSAALLGNRRSEGVTS